MEKIEFVFSFMQKLVTWLVIEGVIFIAIGVLIFVYPDLLGMLVGVFLILSGLLAFYYAFRLKKYTKVQIEL